MLTLTRSETSEVGRLTRQLRRWTRDSSAAVDGPLLRDDMFLWCWHGRLVGLEWKVGRRVVGSSEQVTAIGSVPSSCPSGVANPRRKAVFATHPLSCADAEATSGLASQSRG